MQGSQVTMRLITCTDLGGQSVYPNEDKNKPHLPQTVLIYTYCPIVIFYSTRFHSQKFPSLGVELSRDGITLKVYKYLINTPVV